MGRTSRPLLLLSSLGLIACGDPIVGTWQGTDEVACLLGAPDRVEFEVFSDNTAAGDYCSCDFRFDWVAEGDGRYQIHLDYAASCWALDSSFECELRDDDERLDCGNVGEYRRVD